MVQPDPFSFAGFYTQIPLDANVLLIPYSDLGATSAYGRQLIVPDDIPPVFGLISLIGFKDGAHLATGKHVAGAMDVYQVNASGGTGVTWKPSESGGDGGFGVTSGSTQTGASIGFSGPNPIRSYSFNIMPFPTGTKPGAGAFCEWQVGLIDGSHVIVLAGGLFWNGDWTAAPVPRFSATINDCYIDWQSFGLRPNHAAFYGSSTIGDLQMSDSYILGA